MTIQSGDIVRLKGFAFKMVVSHLAPDGNSARVYWMNITGECAEAQNAAFPIAVLELVSAASDTGAAKPTAVTDTPSRSSMPSTSFLATPRR